MGSSDSGFRTAALHFLTVIDSNLAFALLVSKICATMRTDRA